MIRLNELEEQILEVFWAKGPLFPKNVLEALSQPIPPYNTVLSTIRKLERDGYLGYHIYGKSHQYYPILKKDEYAKSLFSKLYRQILNGSGMSLMSYFLKEENLNFEELENMILQIKNQKP